MNCKKLSEKIEKCLIQIKSKRNRKIKFNQHVTDCCNKHNVKESLIRLIANFDRDGVKR